MVAHILNSSTWEAESGWVSDLKASLLYIGVPGHGKGHIMRLCLQKKKKKNREANFPVPTDYKI